MVGACEATGAPEAMGAPEATGTAAAVELEEAPLETVPAELARLVKNSQVAAGAKSPAGAPT